MSTTTKTKPVSKKSAYGRKIEARLDEIDGKIESLKAKAAKASVDVQVELEERLDGLRAKRRDFKARVARVADAGEDAWEDLTDGIENAWGEIQDAFSDLSKGVIGAVSRFRQPKKSA